MDQNLLGAILGIVGNNGGGGGGSGVDSAVRAAIAPEFSDQQNYSAGDFVWHSNTLYRFTADHSAGAWTGSDAASTEIGQDIQNAEGKEITVTGATPSITAQENCLYLCGEVSTLSFTPSVSGLCAVAFTSGSTAAVLTVPNTVKWPDWFDAANLAANTHYEINIRDGVYAEVGVWAL